MKNLIWVSILTLLISCNSKKHITKTNRVITREIDTLVTIQGRTIHFIPITRDSIEVLVDKATGTIVEIFREDDPETINGQKVTGINVIEPEREIQVKAKETEEEEKTEKEIEGVPWFYQYSLYFALTVFAFIILRVAIKAILPMKM